MSGREVFFLSAKYNRPDLESLIKDRSQHRRREYQIKYDISTSSTVSSKIFRERTAIVGLLGQDPFNDEWLKKEHTFGLRSLGIREIALLPIFSAKGPPIASLSLYSSKSLFVSEIAFLNEFSQFFSLLWENSHLKVEAVRLEKSLLRHEIVGDLTVLTTALAKLEGHTSKYLSDASLPATDIFYQDIRSKISSIQASLRDSGIFDRAHINKSSNTSVDLREEINSNTQPLLFNISRRKVSLPSIFYPRNDIQIRMHPGDLGHIIRNIFENAIKYSVTGATIKVDVAERDGELHLTVSNISRILEEREWTSIWGARVRGQNEAMLNIPGSGLGLFVVAELCKIYSLGYRFWQDPIRDERSDLAWSRVRIQFPKNRVR